MRRKTRASDTGSAVRSAGSLLLARLVLVAAATVVAWLILSTVAGEVPFPPPPVIAALTLLPVNIVCVLLTVRLLRAEGETLRDLFAYHRGTWLRATGWGLIWVVALYVPFAAAVFGTMWLLHGSETLTAFETVFYSPQTAAVIPSELGLILGIVTVLTFAPLNAPAEEMVFRGYAQSRFSRRWPTGLAIAVCSLTFGVQHAFFAPTTDAMLVYVVAFTVWGIGAGLIVLHQRRLLPITIAHFLVDLVTSAPAVVFPALQLTGVIPT